LLSFSIETSICSSNLRALAIDTKQAHRLSKMCCFLDD
jgi:hypothetical protein